MALWTEHCPVNGKVTCSIFGQGTGQISSWGRARGNQLMFHTSMSLSLTLSKKQINKNLKKKINK